MSTLVIIALTVVITHLLDVYGLSGIITGMHDLIQSIIARVSGAAKGGAATGVKPVTPASPATPAQTATTSTIKA